MKRLARFPVLLCLLLLLGAPFAARADHPAKGSFPRKAPLELPPSSEGTTTFRKKKKPSPPPAPAPALKKAAVLFSEANVEFTQRSEWTGGPQNYRAEVEELAALLKKQGIAAEIVTDTQIKDGALWDFRSLYVLDTFSIDKKTFQGIRDFVKGGGLLVGICEVGRFQGGWSAKWPFAEVFGLKTRVVDEWGGGVSNDSFLYHRARITDAGAKEPLLQGLQGKIDFGGWTENIWATDPDGAAALAVFPSHRRAVRQPDGTHRFETAGEPVCAVTLHRYGKGAAIFIAALANARKPGNLEKGPDLPAILKNSQSYAAAKMTRIVPPLPEPVLAYSQSGYLPSQVKRAVLTADPAVPVREPTFILRRHPSDNKVLEGKMQPFQKHLWKTADWTADFSSVREPGEYTLEVGWKQGKQSRTLRSSVFPIDPNVYRLKLIPSQLSFFHEYRCGKRCHTDSPLPGGYHDATGDWSSRMWSMPNVVYGLARYLEVDPSGSDSAREELAWALDWCLKMQGENGEVWAGVVPPREISNIHVRPWEEKATRTIQKNDSQGSRLNYIVAMARAAKAVGPFDPALAGRTLAAAIKTWEFTKKDIQANPARLNETGDIGNWIWGNVQLFAATGDPKYLEEAKQWAPRQIERQHRTPGDVRDEAVCGDFFDSERKEKFGRHQYKTCHQVGIYAGLVDLHAALSPSDPLWWPVHAAIERLVHGYFEPMASVTPYGLVGKALERDAPGEPFRIFFFDNPKAWDGAHFGYNSDYLAEGLVALDYARQTGQPGLVDFADSQVGWMLGNNPLGYSMVDGVGSRIAPMIDDKLGTGRLLGGIPNGYMGEGKDNLPLWGDDDQNWGVREYWLPHNSFFLPLVAELQWRREIPEPATPFGWEVHPTDAGYRVETSEKDFQEHQLELLVDGGTLAEAKPSVENGKAVWTVRPAGNEPLLLLLRDSGKPDVYRQKFLLKP